MKHFASVLFQDAMNDVEVEIDVEEAPQMPFDMGNMGSNVGMINDLSDMFGKVMGLSVVK